MYPAWVNVQMSSRDWRSTLLAALMTSAIAAFGGVLPAGESSTQAVACGTQCGASPSRQSSAAPLDGSRVDASQDARRPPSHNEHHGTDGSRRGGLLIVDLGPRIVACDAACDRSPSHQLTAADPDRSSGDSADDDGDNDDAPGSALAPVPTTLTADGGRTKLSTPNMVDRRVSFASDGHSLRAPPQ